MSRILIMSSDGNLSDKISSALTKANFEVDTASDCLEALLKLDNNKFDLVVVDEELPDIDGWKACPRILQSSTIPIILLGTKTGEQAWANVEEAGFDFYLQKPFSHRELVSRIKAVLRRQPREKVQTLAVDKPAKEEALIEPSLITAVKETVAEVKPEAVPQVEVSPKVWKSIKVMKLLEEMLAGNIAEIKPHLDPTLELGAAYPDAEQVLQASSQEVVSILESLADENILIRQFFDKLILCPKCNSSNLRPSTHCPKCNSGYITRGRVLEHFACGYAGLEDEFKVRERYLCPKCRKELRLIGTDYRSPGLLHKCRNCGELFAEPVLKWRCNRCSMLCPEAELKETNIYSYTLNEKNKQRLDFELKPKSKLISFLKQKGYEVKQGITVRGRSGIEHTLDILAERNNGLFTHGLAISILAAQEGEEVEADEVYKLEAKLSDINIQDRILIAIPRLSQNASLFAKQQRIKVFVPGELNKLFPSLD
jgi:CheY-like chemotaxis protein